MPDLNLLHVLGGEVMTRVPSNTSTISKISTMSNASDEFAPVVSVTAAFTNTIPPHFESVSSIEISKASVRKDDPGRNDELVRKDHQARKDEPLREYEPVREYNPARKDEPVREDDLKSNSPTQVTTVVFAPATVAVARKSKANELLDRQERAIAALLTRFKNLVLLAALPTEDAFAKETAAAEGLRMEVESNALTSAAEDLLKLTRELKELWTFGPLRGIGEGEGDGEMEADSKKVAELIEKQLEKQHEQEKIKA
ncbi:hypothetical protein SBOR_2410 [Sclerotinia borealis F-4128]|uniref:Uncharacterized protein n=1 Tax=Sclerotinia borealis (strain F-4128) TaxID=1432307 RepID=W9CMY8_SCLBF|nr:hypothetical protein SBOR_2410 [Sclerotinia borealis F-4128]